MLLLLLLDALLRTIGRGLSSLGRLPLVCAAARSSHAPGPLPLPPLFASVQRRWGSMKVKRIQRQQPLEKNRVKRLIHGTHLEVKKPKRLEKNKKIRNSDPSKYLTIKPFEFDPLDIRGRSTLIISAPAQRPTAFFTSCSYLILSRSGGTCLYPLGCAIYSGLSMHTSGRASLPASLQLQSEVLAGATTVAR
jgi:hypothetical protein